jgi:hypothetical protein
MLWASHYYDAGIGEELVYDYGQMFWKDREDQQLEE